MRRLEEADGCPSASVDVAVFVVDWRAVGPVAGLAESFLREVMVKPVTG